MLHTMMWGVTRAVDAGEVFAAVGIHMASLSEPMAGRALFANLVRGIADQSLAAITVMLACMPGGNAGRLAVPLMADEATAAVVVDEAGFCVHPARCRAIPIVTNEPTAALGSSSTGSPGLMARMSAIPSIADKPAAAVGITGTRSTGLVARRGAMSTIADETAATIAIDRAWLGESMTCRIRFANFLRGIANQTGATIRIDRAGIVESLAKSDAREVFGIADQISAATRVDSAWAANLMARIQANLPVRVAEEPIATFSIRAGLIALRAGARLAVAPLFREILTPRQALAAAKDITLGTARTERIVREAPGIRRALLTGIRRAATARHSTCRAAVTITIAVVCLNREACRSWAKMRDRLAKRVRGARRTTDALRAERIAIDRRGA